MGNFPASGTRTHDRGHLQATARKLPLADLVNPIVGDPRDRDHKWTTAERIPLSSEQKAEIAVWQRVKLDDSDEGKWVRQTLAGHDAATGKAHAENDFTLIGAVRKAGPAGSGLTLYEVHLLHMGRTSTDHAYLLTLSRANDEGQVQGRWKALSWPLKASDTREPRSQTQLWAYTVNVLYGDKLGAFYNVQGDGSCFYRSLELFNNWEAIQKEYAEREERKLSVFQNLMLNRVMTITRPYLRDNYPKRLRAQFVADRLLPDDVVQHIMTQTGLTNKHDAQEMVPRVAPIVGALQFPDRGSINATDLEKFPEYYLALWDSFSALLTNSHKTYNFRSDLEAACEVFDIRLLTYSLTDGPLSCPELISAPNSKTDTPVVSLVFSGNHWDLFANPYDQRYTQSKNPDHQGMCEFLNQLNRDHGRFDA